MAFRSRQLHPLAAATASAILPGLGQALTGRFRDGAMFFVAMLWIRGFLAAYVGGISGATSVSLNDRAWGFAFGAPAIDGGFRVPLVVVFTGFLVALHVLAAWSAAKEPEKGSGEASGEGDLAR